MRFPFFRNRDSVKNGILISIRRTGDGFHPGLFITAKPKENENEKYAFRCFLLRLGFIGDEYKTDRKVLLANLDGSSAFKAGAKKGGEQ